MQCFYDDKGKKEIERSNFGPIKSKIFISYFQSFGNRFTALLFDTDDGLFKNV